MTPIPATMGASVPGASPSVAAAADHAVHECAQADDRERAADEVDAPAHRIARLGNDDAMPTSAITITGMFTRKIEPQ